MVLTFVGDSIISGEFFDMETCFREMAEKSGFAFVDSSKYAMESISRSFREKKYNADEKKMQHILVFEPIKPKTMISCESAVIAKPSSDCHEVDLSRSIPKDKSIVSLKSGNDYSKLHSLGKYPAKYIPDLPAWAINQYSAPGDIILDPFNGCGTTTTEARLNGRRSIGFDISPYACLLARAKSSYLDALQISTTTEDFLRFLSSDDSKKVTRDLFFENDRFWFSEEALLEIETMRDYIVQNFNGALRDYYMAVLSTIIKPCSFLDESQIKVKRDQRKILKGVSLPYTEMKKALVKYKEVISSGKTIDISTPEAIIINDSALNITTHLQEEEVDLIVTSPPYINAMNYAMNNRYETFLTSLDKGTQAMQRVC